MSIECLKLMWNVRRHFYVIFVVIVLDFF